MSSKTALYDQLQKYQKRIFYRGSKIGAQFEIESVHELRTTVKRLRALLRWLAKGKAGLPKFLKNLFRLSGDIRNIQMFLNSLEKETDASLHLKTWLQAHLSFEQNRWHLAYDPGFQNRLRKKMAALRFHRVSAKRMDQFVLLKKKEIKKILDQPRLTDEQLHSIRKKLKDLEYVLDWCSKIKLTGETTPEFPSIKKITIEAGEFNDKRVALDMMRAYQQKEDITGDEPFQLMMVAWKKEVQRKKRKLIKDLRYFVSTP